MMAQRPTKLVRVTLSQEFKTFVPPEPVKRSVTLITPDNPSISVDIDREPGDLGANRLYKAVPLPTGQAILLKLQPNQFLIGAATINVAHAAYIVEYDDED